MQPTLQSWRPRDGAPYEIVDGGNRQSTSIERATSMDLTVYPPQYLSQGGVPPSTLRKWRQRKARRPEYIPRPCNSFVLFRGDFVRQNIGTGGDLSRRAGIAWKQLPEETKELYRNRAAAAAAEHRRLFPDYVYQPELRGSSSRHSDSVKTTAKESLLTVVEPSTSMSEQREASSISGASIMHRQPDYLHVGRFDISDRRLSDGDLEQLSDEDFFAKKGSQKISEYAAEDRQSRKMHSVPQTAIQVSEEGILPAFESRAHYRAPMSRSNISSSLDAIGTAGSWPHLAEFSREDEASSSSHAPVSASYPSASAGKPYPRSFLTPATTPSMSSASDSAVTPFPAYTPSPLYTPPSFGMNSTEPLPYVSPPGCVGVGPPGYQDIATMPQTADWTTRYDGIQRPSVVPAYGLETAVDFESLGSMFIPDHDFTGGPPEVAPTASQKAESARSGHLWREDTLAEPPWA